MAEKKVEFNEITGKTVYAVTNEDTGVTMAEITGYDIEVKFNMEAINTIEEIDATVSGIASIFKDLLLNNMLEVGK